MYIPEEGKRDKIKWVFQRSRSGMVCDYVSSCFTMTAIFFMI